MQTTDLFVRYGVALVVGFLVGLQREVSWADGDKNHAAGVRTFTIMGGLGCAAAHLSGLVGSPVAFGAVVLTVGAFLAVNYYVEASAGRLGLTTKIASLLTLIIGALVYLNQMALGVALGVAVTVVLSIKPEMHRLVHHITKEDIYATLKFAVITAIVLPILPNQSYGPVPFAILNPLKIWLLVVFISGISFVGYVLIKVVGTKRGIGLTGLMGGLVSSTAVTLSFTQRSRENASLSKSFALAIIVAWTVMYLRVLAAVAVLNIALVRLIWLPLVISACAGLIYCLYLFKSERVESQQGVAFSNPFELGPAIKFGLLFAVILLISKVAQVYLGNAGVYLSSFVSGLADVDAIALSMARLSKTPDGITPMVAAQAIVLATVANTLLKGGIVLASGAVELKKAMLPGYLLMLGVGIGVMFLVSVM